jgi:hypothetical protein
MGYTHYWNHDGIDEEQWAGIMRDALIILSNVRARGITLAGGNGTGKPEITADMIRFNGADPDDYETFAIGRNHTSFDFCKTEYRPYDLAVMLMLLAAHRRVDSFQFRSDGEWESDEWEQGRAMFTELFGAGAIDTSRMDV